MTAVSKGIAHVHGRFGGQAPGAIVGLIARLKMLFALLGEGLAESRSLAQAAYRRYPFFAEW